MAYTTAGPASIETPNRIGYQIADPPASRMPVATRVATMRGSTSNHKMGPALPTPIQYHVGPKAARLIAAAMSAASVRVGAGASAMEAATARTDVIAHSGTRTCKLVA